jgi:predicted transcriptional regulator
LDAVELQNAVVLRTRQRVLFYIMKRGRKYRANISQVARDMELSDGNVNQYVNDLKAAGLLKVVQKGGVEYFRVTWKGQISLYPLLLPRLLTLFVVVIALAQISWAEPVLLTGRWTVSPWLLVASGLILVTFAAILWWAENRMDEFLLEAKWSSGRQKASSAE